MDLWSNIIAIYGTSISIHDSTMKIMLSHWSTAISESGDWQRRADINEQRKGICKSWRYRRHRGAGGNGDQIQNLHSLKTIHLRCYLRLPPAFTDTLINLCVIQLYYSDTIISASITSVHLRVQTNPIPQPPTSDLTVISFES